MIFVAILFLLIGAVVKYGKAYFLIAGYNTLSKKEKERYDAKAIAHILWKSMLGMSALIITGVILSEWLDRPDIESIGLYLSLAIGIPYLLYQTNTKGQKPPRS